MFICPSDLHVRLRKERGSSMLLPLTPAGNWQTWSCPLVIRSLSQDVNTRSEFPPSDRVTWFAWADWVCTVAMKPLLKLYQTDFKVELGRSFLTLKTGLEGADLYFYMICAYIYTWSTSPDSISAKWGSRVPVPSTPGLNHWCVAKNM